MTFKLTEPFLKEFQEVAYVLELFTPYLFDVMLQREIRTWNKRTDVYFGISGQIDLINLNLAICFELIHR